MKSFRFLLILSVVTVLSISCSKDEKDETPPVIAISSPTEGMVLNRGSEFNLRATITDNKQLKEINVGNALKITTFNSPTSHEVNEIFIISADQVLGNIKLEITATDAAGNSAVKSVNLKIE